MDLPASFYASSVSEKDILLFSSKDLDSDEPHLFICIKKAANDILIFTVTTTQIQKVYNRVAAMGEVTDTVVDIPSKHKDPNSPFDKDCCVNCNAVFKYSIAELKLMFESRNCEVIKRPLPQSIYEKIVNGVCLSNLIDEELKDSLNNSE